MDIQVARFREALGLLKPVVPRKPSVESLRCILLKDGQAHATDLETFVSVPMPEVDGIYLLNFQDVSKMIEYTNGGEFLNITRKKGKITLSWSEGKYTLPMLAEDTFPAVPDFKTVAEASLDTDTLIPAMIAVLPYAATDATRAVLAGVTVVFGNPMEVAAGDGYRLAHKALGLEFPENKVVVIPYSSVKALDFLWRKTPRTPPETDALVAAIMAKKHAMVALDKDRGLRFRFGDDTTAIIKLVQGDPPAWLKLLPKGEPLLQVNLFATDLEPAVRRVAQVANASKGIVRMVFNDGTATIAAKSEDQEVQSSIKVDMQTGEPNKFALNIEYLLDYLRDKEGIINIAWTGGASPVTFQHGTHPKVLIMPMEAKW